MNKEYIKEFGIGIFAIAGFTRVLRKLQLNHAVKSYDGNNIIYTYQNITLTLPKAWKGRYVITENEDQKGFTVLQKASNDKQEGWGFLFSIYASDMPYVDMPGGEALAYTKDRIYYFSTPTDVPYDYEDAEVTEDYQDMMQDFLCIR